MRPVLCVPLVLAAALPAVAQSGETVRVRVLESAAPREVVLEAVSGSVKLDVDGRRVGEIRRGERATVSYSSSGVTMRAGRGAVSGARARVSGDRFRVRVGDADRQYAGELIVRTVGSHLELVNETPLRPYVASVVASELGFDVTEAAKAQAILARTYALRRLGADGTFDLDDHQGSQVFRGLTTITATSRLAADGTAGEVLTYAGDLAEATYFSSSGGHTANNETVWRSAPVPYLRGVPDPYDSRSPHHTWTTRLPKRQVLSALESVVGRGATGIVVEEQSRSGRVTQMRAIGAERPTFTGAQFRRHVNAVLGWRTIRSTKFDLSIEGNQYVLRGKGFGHGVGMSQYGAIGQAREGRSYQDILTYYFTGARVEGGRALPGPLTTTEPIRRDPEPEDESLSLHSRYLLTDPRRQDASHGRNSAPGDGSSPSGEPVQETAPQSRDDRAGDRRQGGDRRTRADRRESSVRQTSTRRRTDRRQSTDRRQATAQTPPAELADRTAW